MRIEVTGLDQEFSSVDGGSPVVVKGLNLRDSGYGLRGTLGSRGFFELADPFGLATRWQSVELSSDLSKLLECGAVAQATAVSILELISL